MHQALMDDSEKFTRLGAPTNTCGLDTEQTVNCPLPFDTVKDLKLTLDLSNALKGAGCPVSTAIHGRLRFETLLSELSAKFVNLCPNEVDSQIDSGLRMLVELLGLDRAGLGEITPDGKKFMVTHSYQLPGIPPSTQLALHAQFPSYSKMLCQGKVVRLPEDLPQATPEHEYCLRIGLRSHLAIPLTMMGTVVGGIGFSSFRANLRLSDELIPRLRIVGDIFTNALTRKRTDEALRAKEQSLIQSQARLRELASKLLHAQEEERRRIAREMHDDWTQRLAILGLETSKLKKHLDAPEKACSLISAISEQLVSLSEDMHELSRQLHPSILDDLGLIEALRSECASFSRRERMNIAFNPIEITEKIPSEVALCLYRVVQESLRNIVRHACTKNVSLAIFIADQELVLQVRDQGAGFDPKTTRLEPGLGLCSIEERVRLIEGQLAITSALGQGTSVEVRVTLPKCDYP
jgi:signal transduction histidine kinase